MSKWKICNFMQNRCRVVRVLQWPVLGPSSSSLHTAAASLRRVMFPWETEWDTLWKGAQPEQTRSCRAKPRQTGSRLFSPRRWSSEGWLPFCPGWQSESEDVVNAIAHEAVKAAHSVGSVHCRPVGWVHCQHPTEITQDTDPYVHIFLNSLLRWKEHDLQHCVERGAACCFHRAGLKNDFHVVGWLVLDSHCMSSGRKLQSAAAACSTQSTQLRLCVLQRPVFTPLPSLFTATSSYCSPKPNISYCC